MVFISYAYDDIDQVRRIIRGLKRSGIDVWTDKRNLQGGDLWTTKIAEAISTCDLFLLFVSGSSMKSDSVRREVQLAFEKKKKIIILRLEEAKIPQELEFQLAGIQWITAGEKNWRAKLRTGINADFTSHELEKTQTTIQISGEIGVLLVDDNPLARAAWRRALGKSKLIKVIGDSTIKGLVEQLNSFPPPDTIIAGLSFLEQGLLKSNRMREFWGTRPRFIILADNDEQVKSAFKHGADWAVRKPFESQDLITWVRALSDDAKRLCSEYWHNYSAIQVVESENSKYSDLVGKTLQLIFHPDLVNPENARKPQSTTLVNRLVFRNQARDHKFWIDAREIHKSKYVPIDIYNAKITPEQISVLGKYLSDTHGYLGLIIGRTFQPDRLIATSIALFENEKKVILSLSDSHLQTMLEYKAGGVNPVYELEHLYQKLIADAES